MSTQSYELARPIAQVFGGCCTNVIALEFVLRDAPGMGSFLTFIQFLFVAGQTLPQQLTFKHEVKQVGSDGEARIVIERSWLPRLKTRQVPLKRWALQVLMFLGVSWLNNWAFSFNIPVSVHIIFRSGGLAVSMLTNYLMKGRRYAPLQILAVCLVSTGIILATFSTPPRHPKPSSSSFSSETADRSGVTEIDFEYLLGVAILLSALVISAVMGLYQETTYKKYGNCWREGLFYSHFLSLPLFAPLIPSLPSTLQTLNASPPLQVSLLPFIPPSLVSPSSGPSWLEPKWLINRLGLDFVLRLPIPSVWVALAINVITQAVCVGGVNRLTAKVSSLTTSLVLTLRKAVSLVLSVWWFSGFDQVGWGLVIGGGLVLVGTALYSLAEVRARSTPAAQKTASFTVEESRRRKDL